MFMDAGRLVGGAAVLDADIERVIVWHLFDPRLPADAIPELGETGAYAAGGAVHRGAADPVRIGRPFEVDRKGGFWHFGSVESVIDPDNDNATNA
jgi:hypothetical protein